jgi:hypothetical protein
MQGASSPAACLRHAVGFAATLTIACAGDVRAQAVAASQLDRVEVTGRHYDNAVGSTDAASEGTIRAELLKSRPRCVPRRCWSSCPA